ncbi:MAG: hypothetical protein BGO14_02460 [Chlamydiales bacterium 38-26]|nr:hypothetical protein [Chlamydiales bacterium]OJV09218.1 MAG: hypothetical protein BGO14_02460 [Chlamydiales bacterium 38-26]
MRKNELDVLSIEVLLEEMIQQQKKVMLRCAKRILPQVIADDLLQPNDFPEIEGNPIFRYEEGVLAGIQSVQMALRAILKER